MKRLISLVLTVMMVISLFPFFTFAEGDEAGVSTEVVETPAEEKTEKKSEPVKEEKPAKEPAKAEETVKEEQEEPAAEKSVQAPEAPEESQPISEKEPERELAAEAGPEQTAETEETVGPESEPEREKAQPVSITVKALKDTEIVNGEAEFAVKAEASDGSELRYQWQRLDTSVNYQNDAERESAWEDIEKETGASLKLKNMTAESFESEYAKLVFRCLITAKDGTAAYTGEVKLLADPAWNDMDGKSEKSIDMEGDVLAEEKETDETDAAKPGSMEPTENEADGDNGETSDPFAAEKMSELGAEPHGSTTEFALSIEKITALGPTEVQFSGKGTAIYAEEDYTYSIYIDFYNVVDGEYEYFVSTSWGVRNNMSEESYSRSMNCFTPGTIYAVSGRICTDETWNDPVFQTDYYVFKMVAANSDGSNKCGDNLIWNLSENGTLTILGSGNMWNQDHAPWYDLRNEICNVVFDEGVTGIGDNAFDECSALTSVTIPDGVSRIGNSAFIDCRNLSSIVIPDSVKIIGNGAFSGCGSLKSVTIPNMVTSIGNYTFNSAGLTAVTIPPSVTNIGDYAFCACGLTSVIIPASITSIGSNAFSCGSLLTIKFLGDAPDIGNDAFRNVTATVTVPDDAAWNDTEKQNYGGSLDWGTWSCEHQYGRDHICIYCGRNDPDYLFELFLDSITVKGPTEVWFDTTVTAQYPEEEDTYCLALDYYIVADGEYEYFTSTSQGLGNDLSRESFSVETFYFSPDTTYGVRAKICTDETWEEPILQTDYYRFTTKSGAGIEILELGREYSFPEGETANVLKYTSQFDSRAILSATSAGECWVLFPSRWPDEEDICVYPEDGDGEFQIKKGETIYIVSPAYEENYVQVDLVRVYDATPRFEVSLDDITVLGPTEVQFDSTVTAIYPDSESGCIYWWALDFYNVVNGKFEYFTSNSTGIEDIVENKKYSDTAFYLKPGTTYAVRAKVCTDDTWHNPFAQTGYYTFTTPSDANVEQLQLNTSYDFPFGEAVSVMKYVAPFAAHVSITNAGECWVLSDAFWDGKDPLYIGEDSSGEFHFKSGDILYVISRSWSSEDNSSFEIDLVSNDTYAVSYQLNSGTNSANNPQTYDYGDQIALRVPTRLGYVFSGWYLDEELMEYAEAPEITPETTGDITFYAKWSKNSYKVNFNANGGTGKMTALPAVPYDTEWPLPANAFAKKGYSFAGWSLTANGSSGIIAEDEGNVLNLTDTPNGTATLYAQWQLATYSIAYELFGGANSAFNPDSYTITSDTITLQIPEACPEGCAFAGWYKDKTFKSRVTQIRKGSTGDLTLYARWTSQPYSITYVPNGGVSAKNAPKSFTVASPEIELPVPTRRGYTFLGWFESMDFAGEAVTTIPTGTTGNKTFYANWELVEYTIEYVLTIGENTPENPVIYTVDSEAITLYAPVLPDDLTFGGWYADAALKKKVTGIKTGSAGDLTLYAKLIGTQYKVTYYLNGGTNAKKNPKSYMAKTGTFDLQPATRKGYDFLGWYRDASFAGEPVTAISQTDTGVLSFYAKWAVANYSITYVTNGGKEAQGNPETYTIATDTFTPAAPTRRGCTFAGWYSDAACKKKVTQIKRGSTGDITLYAKWTENTYKVVFNANGGKGKLATKTYKYGYLYQLPVCTIMKAGYIFTGWNTKPDGTGVDYDDGAYVYNMLIEPGTITLYAQWES